MLVMPARESIDTGGTADPSFYFQNTASSLTASLKLEMAGNEDINQFGWYDITRPSVLHPLFLGPDSPPATQDFSPSAHYGFYLSGAGSNTAAGTSGGRR